MIVTITATVRPDGSALLNTLPKNEPVTLASFGSIARKKDGMPTNSPLISVSWIGSNG